MSWHRLPLGQKKLTTVEVLGGPLANGLPDCLSLSHVSSSAAAKIWIVSGVKAVSRRKNSRISTIFSLTQRTREHCCVEGGNSFTGGNDLSRQAPSARLLCQAIE